MTPREQNSIFFKANTEIHDSGYMTIQVGKWENGKRIILGNYSDVINLGSTFNQEMPTNLNIDIDKDGYTNIWAYGFHLDFDELIMSNAIITCRKLNKVK